MASIEELMKAVRTLKAGGGAASADVPSAPKCGATRASADSNGVVRADVASVRRTDNAAVQGKTESMNPQPIVQRGAMSSAAAGKPASPSTRQAILDDPKLNSLLKTLSGAKIVEIKER